MRIAANLISREVLPFYLSLFLLAAATLFIDALLHLLGLFWIGRYLGIPGILLIIFSFGYSLRKRNLIGQGRPVVLLRLHERMAWAGSLLILVHAGVHFQGILAWLAVGAMMINVASGLRGKFLLGRSRKRIEDATQRLRAEGLSTDDMQERLYWDSLTFDVVKEWRAVHYPISLAFAVLAIAHIVSVFLFWGWR
jgi:hypothetical protein